MSQTVHFLPVGFGRKHSVQPFISGEFSPWKIVLLVPADEERQGMSVENTKKFLDDNVDIKTEVRSVSTDRFDRIVAAGYHEILKELEAGNDVFINAASSPWGLGAGYARAAEYVLSDARQQGQDDTEPKLRDRITLYYTEPEGYHIDELTAVASQAKELKKRVKKTQEAAGNLREDVNTDVRTIEILLWILRMHPDFLEKINRLLEMVPDDRVGEIAEGFEHILEGIESLTEGINKLAKEENRKLIKDLPVLVDPRVEEFISGLEQVAERADEHDEEGTTDGAYTQVDLFQYFLSRLERVQDVLENVEEIESDPYGNPFERSADDIDTLRSEVESDGIAHGVRKFNGSSYSELPKPLDLDLSNLQRAIFYTLAADGSVESLQQLTIRVAHRALAHAADNGAEIPSHPSVDAVRRGDASPQNQFFKDMLVARIQTRIQYNVNSLDDAGLVVKNNKMTGRGVHVSLSHSGKIYAAVRGLDADESDRTEWYETAFEELSEDVVEYANDYVQSDDSPTENGS